MSRQLSHWLFINLIGFALLGQSHGLVFGIDKPDNGLRITPAPSGINSLCLGEWSRHKELIIHKRDSLYYALIDKARCSHKEKVQQVINGLKARLAYLDKVIELASRLEKSDMEYALQATQKPEGSTSYDAHKKRIVLTVGSTANFIHELIHGGQYEVGEIIFDSVLNKSYLQDLYDETEAYKAQFAYEPASVTALISNSGIRSLDDITPQWVENLRAEEGEEQTYREHSRIRVNIHSDKAVLLEAYPQLAAHFKGWADHYTMKDVPNMVYKK